MNIGQLVEFINSITDKEVSEHILSAVDNVANVYVPPLCKVIAMSCTTLHDNLMKEGFTRDEAIRIVVAIVGKGNKK